MYQTNSSTLGISYALYDVIIVWLLSGSWFGRCSLIGRRAKSHSFGISFPLHPGKMGLPSGENTVTSYFVSKTVQSASQMGLAPTRVLVNDSMMFPIFGKSDANCRIVSEAVADKLSTCPVAVPTQMFGVPFWGGPCGAVEKCKCGLLHSELNQFHAAGESVEPPLSCWVGGSV